MKRNGLIVALVAFVALIAAAVVLAGCGGSGSGWLGRRAASRRRACRPRSTTARSSRGSPVDVSPAPETDTANPARRSASSACRPREIHVVSVVGAHSGAHAGHLEAYSQGDGASFVPDKPFDAGERVLVHAVIGAGPVAGAHRRPASRSPSASASTRPTRRRTCPRSRTRRPRRPTTRASTRCPACRPRS